MSVIKFILLVGYIVTVTVESEIIMGGLIFAVFANSIELWKFTLAYDISLIQADTLFF